MTIVVISGVEQRGSNGLEAHDATARFDDTYIARKAAIWLAWRLQRTAIMRALILSLFASLSFTPAAPVQVEASKPVCVKVADIGALPLTVDVAGTKVQFTEWQAKDADAQELIGFRATTTGPVSFVVRAGGETFQAGTEWQNPHGVVGKNVRGIDGLEVCR